MTPLGKLRSLSDLDGFTLDYQDRFESGSRFAYWRYCRYLPAQWDFVQVDMDVWSILESIGIDKDAYRYLLVAVGDGEYEEIWGTNSFRLNGMAEQLFWMGRVTASG